VARIERSPRWNAQSSVNYSGWTGRTDEVPPLRVSQSHLPTLAEALCAERYGKAMAEHLNDRVEDIHRVLVEDERYRALLGAVSNKQAVEGSLVADNTLAAMMIRAKAKETGDDIAKEKRRRLPRRSALCCGTTSSGHSSRHDFANAAIAASRVGS
jgi:hypothetical protein